jgi:hypothetical protein
MASAIEKFIDQVLDETLKSSRHGSREFGEEVNALTRNLILRHVQSLPSRHLVLLIRASVVSGALLNTNRKSSGSTTKLTVQPPPIPARL